MTLIPTQAIIPAAGLGIRLLTTTKEMPKEMLPVFSKGIKGEILIKPTLQVVFEQLYDSGIREFCFVVGRGERTIEEHFSKDSSFVSYLRRKGKSDFAEELDAFYRKLEDSSIVFVNQPEPRGFGDAVYRARSFVRHEPFLVRAGDDLVFSTHRQNIETSLVKLFEKMSPDAVLAVQKATNPRSYGVISGDRVGPAIYRVTHIVEKPKRPPSNMAIVASYVFNLRIFDAIEQTRHDSEGELQLTDAIRKLVIDGRGVYAVELRAGERRIDIGTSRSYWDALRYTFEACAK
jgi:UTP--glucose-1-phosphate uridylyltransferase